MLWAPPSGTVTSRLVTPPTAEPLTLDFLKWHLRVIDYADDDSLIEFYGKAAREYTEMYIGWALMQQTWDQWWDGFPLPRTPLELVRQPLVSVASFTYTDSTGAVNTLVQGTDYLVDLYSDPPRLAPAFGKLWPGSTLQPIYGVNARVVAGYGGIGATVAQQQAAIPWQLKQMVLVLLGHWYENRSDVEIDNRLRALEIPRQFNDLAAKFSPPLLA